jgi:hypothetical protein
MTQDPGQRQRRDAAIDLWQIAERVKIELAAQESSAGKCGFPWFDGKTAFSQYLSQHRRLDQETLRGLLLCRDEVDVLVRVGMRKSVDTANRMIAARLQPDEDVHVVHGLGNGWRYPLVPEVLGRGLRVRFLTNKLHVDLDNLKHAVAKGAVLALALSQRLQGIGLEFDSSLTDRLPFDIQYRDQASGGYRTLFNENSLYRELREQTIAVPRPEKRDQGVTSVILTRSWPGDESPQPYLYFRFKEPVRGTLSVRYTPTLDPPCFIMTDLESGAETRGEEAPNETYLAAIESGQL